VAIAVVVGIAGPGGGATATKDFLFRDDPVGSGPGTPTADRPIPPGLKPSLARAADPESPAAPPWTMRVYDSTSKGTCLLAGRLVGGEIGRAQSGKFVPLDHQFEGFCGDLYRAHYVMTTRDDAASGADRSLLYGKIDYQVDRLELATGGGSRLVHIFNDLTFLSVRVGTRAFAGDRLIVHYRDGRSDTVVLQPWTPKHPDPG
jgi:hypothetical protein